MSGATVSNADSEAGGGNGPIRVMIVDDAVAIRGALARWIASDPGLSVVATARNGRSALDQIKTVDPDVVILDIEMPEMDGITALPLLLKSEPTHRDHHGVDADAAKRRDFHQGAVAGRRDYVPNQRRASRRRRRRRARRFGRALCRARRRVALGGDAVRFRPRARAADEAIALRKASMVKPQMPSRSVRRPADRRRSARS